MSLDYLLPIDSNNLNYQFIHLDLDREYGIACKFNFNNRTSFEITHAKILFTNPKSKDETSFHALMNISNIEPHNHSDYNWQIIFDVEKNDSRSAEDVLTKKPQSGTYKIKSASENLSSIHIIDVKIKNLEKSVIPLKDRKKYPFVKFGSHFCKFYIV